MQACGEDGKSLRYDHVFTAFYVLLYNECYFIMDRILDASSFELIIRGFSFTLKASFK